MVSPSGALPVEEILALGRMAGDVRAAADMLVKLARHLRRQAEEIEAAMDTIGRFPVRQEGRRHA